MKKLASLSLIIGLLVLFSCNQTSKEQQSTTEQKSVDMEYYFSTTLTGEMDSIVNKVEAALKDEGFGVITTINIKDKLKEKLDVDFRPYLILGACSPSHAYQALQAEDKIGTMLPCNVIIQEISDGKYEVAAVNPIASMQAIKNEELGAVAAEVTDRLQKVIQNLK